MRDTSVVQIDLSAIDHNMGVLRRAVGPDVGICPVVKADAYGLGAGRVAKRLAGGGARMLAVYTPEQAADLARFAVAAPVLILMPVWEIDRTDELYRGLISSRLHLSVHGIDHLHAVIRIAERFGTVLPVHLEIDTGMSRGGTALSDAGEALRQIAASRWTQLAGVFTHFAEAESASPATEKQLRDFSRLIEEHASLIPENCLIHAANTYATVRSEKFHLTMIRVGLAWMGLGPELIHDGQVIDPARDLQPVVSWTSRVIHEKRIRAGARVGYGGTWRAERKSRIGLVPVGYADGYPMQCGSASAADPAMVGVHVEGPSSRPSLQEASHHSESRATGSTIMFAPVVGEVSMDQITVDLTDLPEGRSGVGSTVEIISQDRAAPNHVVRLAQRAGTIPHEMLSRINPRLRRAYVARPVQIETSPHAVAIAAV